MRLIVWSFSTINLLKDRLCRSDNADFAQASPETAAVERFQQTRRNQAKEKLAENQRARTPSKNAANLNPSLVNQLQGIGGTMTTAMILVPSSGGNHLQVTHNRLAGSGRGGLTSWLFAFNWSLFPDPVLVWNASDESAAWGLGRNCQWQISSSTPAGRAPLLLARESVPQNLRRIWKSAPLAASEGLSLSSSRVGQGERQW